MELEDHLNEKVPGVVCLMETKVNKDTELTNNGERKYNIQRQDRQFKKGEVMIMTNTRIMAKMTETGKSTAVIIAAEQVENQGAGRVGPE